MSHMSIKFAQRLDVGSEYVDIRHSPKMDVLVVQFCYKQICSIENNKTVKLPRDHCDALRTF